MSLAQFLETIESCDSVVYIDRYLIQHLSPNDISALLLSEDPILGRSIETFHATDAYQITVVLK